MDFSSLGLLIQAQELCPEPEEPDEEIVVSDMETEFWNMSATWLPYDFPASGSSVQSSRMWKWSMPSLFHLKMMMMASCLMPRPPRLWSWECELPDYNLGSRNGGSSCNLGPSCKKGFHESGQTSLLLVWFFKLAIPPLLIDEWRVSICAFRNWGFGIAVACWVLQAS